MKTHTSNYSDFIATLTKLVGKKHVLLSESETAYYRKGWRETAEPALAVIRPATLLEQWEVLEACVKADVAIIMQAANTSLTGGSTPIAGYDRPVVIINTTRVDKIQFLSEGEQIIAFSGATLYRLESMLQKVGRAPHSVIGSSCIGASIVGGICNNSGGALVERGPAFTELALYAQLNDNGKLELVNHLDINLGDSPKEILSRLQKGDYTVDDVQNSERNASDKEYKDWVRDTNSDRPARFNADPRRLKEASGCAGKLGVFAVRLDSFTKAAKQDTFYLATNSTECLQQVRRTLLENSSKLPISAEYMHQDIFNLTDNYGRETVIMIRRLGTKYLPSFFKIKQSLDNLAERLPLVPKNVFHKCIYFFANLFPSQVPTRIRKLNEKYEHQLILSVQDGSQDEVKGLLEALAKDSDLQALHCNDKEGRLAYLQRFAAAGAAVQYAEINNKTAEGLVALDIALPRNSQDWFETLPPELAQKISHRLYYGHFLCHVFHQDYIVRKGEDLAEVKAALLKLTEQRGAEYPAEHNVGHAYTAKPALAEHYRKLDPDNRFNPGIGKMSKLTRYKE